MLNIREKSWGPNYVNFRFFLEDDFETDSQYSIGVSTNFTDLNSLGAEFRLNIEMGSDKLVLGELYTPLLFNTDFFTTVTGSYSSEKVNIPKGGMTDTSLSASRDYIPVAFNEWGAEWAFGYQNALWSRINLGFDIQMDWRACFSPLSR